jgi:hypothetical protein
VTICGGWPDPAGTRSGFGGCWRWRLSATAEAGRGLQIVRDWVARFNAEGPDGLIDRKAPGKAPTLTPA